jgi:hypothetical protein
VGKSYDKKEGYKYRERIPEKEEREQRCELFPRAIRQKKKKKRPSTKKKKTHAHKHNPSNNSDAREKRIAF